MNVEIDFEEWSELLDARREEWNDGEHREIPDCVWNWTMELLEETGGLPDPALNSPRYIVDNLLVNGSWAEFDDEKQDGETDEDFIERIEDKALAVFPDERLVLYNTGL